MAAWSRAEIKRGGATNLSYFTPLGGWREGGGGPRRQSRVNNDLKQFATLSLPSISWVLEGYSYGCFRLAEKTQHRAFALWTKHSLEYLVAT